MNQDQITLSVIAYLPFVLQDCGIYPPFTLRTVTHYLPLQVFILLLLLFQAIESNMFRHASMHTGSVIHFQKLL